MLTSPFLEFVLEAAPEEGNFCVDLPEDYRELDETAAGGSADEQAKVLLRDYLLINVVRPLIGASSSVRFYHTVFTEKSFGGEGARLPEILRKRRNVYELSGEHDPIESFERFWNGVAGDGSRRGYVLFAVDDEDFDLRPIFSHCYDPGVMSSSSLRSTLGASLQKAIASYIADNPRATAVLLGYAGNLGNLTVFPGTDVFDKRLNQAISSTRTFHHRD